MTAQTLRSFAVSTRGLMWLCLIAVALAAWAYLATFQDSLQALCRMVPLGVTLQDGTFVFSMWLAMAMAMMLPAAAPMISAYLDIAEAARVKSIRVVPPVILAAGYCLVWLGFAAGMSVVQIGAGRWLPSPDSNVAGAALALAGLYQFSPLKHACLTKCRAPMPYFLRRWSDRSQKVFLMGLEQGILCLGCCWALMTLALLTGFMNLAWMTAVGAIAILEKTLPEPRPIVYGSGLGLLGAGLALIVFG